VVNSQSTVGHALSMPAYVIAEITLHDPEQYANYTAAVPATLAAHGGRLVALSEAPTVLEGDWEPERLVLLEFADVDAAQRWYASPEYTEARRLREGAATLRLVALG
jgi:uncharacterized protein (DUF1330 family)